MIRFSCYELSKSIFYKYNRIAIKTKTPTIQKEIKDWGVFSFRKITPPPITRCPAQ